MQRITTPFVLLILFLTASSLDAAESGRQILDRRKALDDGEQHWADRHQQMRLHIFDANGSERQRELEMYEKRLANDELKAIVFLRAPAEVRGTAFLAFSHRGKPADQWLYLPEFKRVRQITASTRNERFVGTDLTYHELDLLAEMTSWSDTDAVATLRHEEPVEGVACYAIELDPRREDIGYKRIFLWLGRDDLVPRQVEFYEQAAGGGWLGGLIGSGTQVGQLSKRVRQRDVQLVGNIPVPHTIAVETIANGTRTTIEVSGVEFNQNLDDDLFTQRALERGGK